MKIDIEGWSETQPTVRVVGAVVKLRKHRTESTLSPSSPRPTVVSYGLCLKYTVPDRG